jgi:hypothetical protein
LLRAGSVQSARDAVTTVKQAQVELNKEMGTSLPVTGYINADWQKAISNWQKSKSYFQSASAYQAKQAGFDSYGEYLKAWKAKQGAVTHHGFGQFFLNALPLQAFKSGSDPLSVAEHLAADPFSNPSWHDPSYPLHALTRSAGEALSVLGGSVEQTKAYLAAGHAFFEHVGIGLNGRNFDTGVAAAKKTLLEHPSWLRAFYPDLSADPKGWVKVADDVSNIAGDVLLLRKPMFTGERVLPGSVDVAAKSSYLNRAGGYAFAYLRQGKIGRAAALLEGGPGAERLVAALAKAVKAGKMSREQFTQHLAELYATGRTTIPRGESVAKSAGGAPEISFAYVGDDIASQATFEAGIHGGEVYGVGASALANAHEPVGRGAAV